MVLGNAKVIWAGTCPEHSIKIGDLCEARVMGVQGNAAGRLGHCHAVVVRIGKGIALQGGPVAQHWQPCSWEALCKAPDYNVYHRHCTERSRHLEDADATAAC